MTTKLKVLFLESQVTLLSDSQVHYLLMQHFVHDHVEVHIACNPGVNGTKSMSLRTLEAIPHANLVPTAFGSSLSGRSRIHAVAESGSALGTLLHMARYIRQHQIDIIHIPSRPRDALYGVVLGKMTGARSLIHLHVMVSDWFGAPMRWSLRNCDAILGISDFVARTASAAGYDAGKTHCVLNGLDITKWDPSLDGTRVRQEFGIVPDTPLLAIVSRLFYWKGHTELLKALALVRPHVPTFKLLVVGEDDRSAHPGGKSYRAELQALAHDLGLGDNIIFTGFRQDIPEILAACDVFTMPSYEEPLGLAFLEAMAMRKPVIALDSGGVPEVVQNGKSGLLSKPHDVEALAANIITVLRDSNLRRTMGAHGRSYVEQNHNPRQTACKTEQVYRRVLSANR